MSVPKHRYDTKLSSITSNLREHCYLLNAYGFYLKPYWCLQGYLLSFTMVLYYVYILLCYIHTFVFFMYVTCMVLWNAVQSIDRSIDRWLINPSIHPSIHHRSINQSQWCPYSMENMATIKPVGWYYNNQFPKTSLSLPKFVITATATN